ncbi:MAG TPA: ABC transporter permease subunit [Candidatus Aquicultor sp.]|jgi:ABC-2 type transport system permease protein
MKSSILAIAKQEIRIARTERLQILLLAIFVGMVFLSSFIGWSAHHTVMNVYTETVRQGATAVANPFANQPQLELLKNTVIYIVLIGALLAILIGVRSSLHDRKAGVIDIILSRPLSMRQYIAGKILGVQITVASILLITGVISWLGISIVLAHPLGLVSTVAILKFYLTAWLFLFPFSILGMVFGACSCRETTALLIPILIWVLFAFVIPQLGTAEHPSALLNPVPAQAASQGEFFSFNRSILQPISITDRFKSASGAILQFSDATGPAAYDWAALTGIAVASCFLVLFITPKAMRRELYE